MIPGEKYDIHNYFLVKNLSQDTGVFRPIDIPLDLYVFFGPISESAAANRLQLRIQSRRWGLSFVPILSHNLLFRFASLVAVWFFDAALFALRR
jgi:hypothetical protein